MLVIFGRGGAGWSDLGFKISDFKAGKTRISRIGTKGEAGVSVFRCFGRIDYEDDDDDD